MRGGSVVAMGGVQRRAGTILYIDHLSMFCNFDNEIRDRYIPHRCPSPRLSTISCLHRYIQVTWVATCFLCSYVYRSYSLHTIQVGSYIGACGTIVIYIR